MQTLVAVMLTTLAAKLLVEGVNTLPKYCSKKGTTALGRRLVNSICCSCIEIVLQPIPLWSLCKKSKVHMRQLLEIRLSMRSGIATSVHVAFLQPGAEAQRSCCSESLKQHCTIAELL